MKQIDILRGSKEVKKLIVERSTKFSIPLKYICYELGINYHDFMMSYINSDTMGKCSLTEDDFINILNMLGVKIRYQFVLENNFDGLEVRTDLIKKHG